MTFFAGLYKEDAMVKQTKHKASELLAQSAEPFDKACMLVIELEKSHERLIQAARCALADLEGTMPEFDSSGDRQHPGWKTIEELKIAIKVASQH